MDPVLVKVNRADLNQTDKLTYLRTIIRLEGGSEEDILNRVRKVRKIFKSMHHVWRFAQCSTNTKLKLHHSCAVFTILYESECWEMTRPI